ncbi:MAG: hypothetical protein K0Q87_4455 [Neobacillus sp.]|jgi:4'-phosphopantetheinyl transferase|nr:hypothetical protein [Neobacillus sp.]
MYRWKKYIFFREFTAYFPEISDCYFNISHSGDWVVGTIGTVPLGIDIEEMVRLDLLIAKHFFQNMSG